MGLVADLLVLGIGSTMALICNEQDRRVSAVDRVVDLAWHEFEQGYQQWRSSMGFVIEPIQLDLSGTPYEGLTVLVRRGSVGEISDLGRWEGLTDDEAGDALLRQLSAVILSWDLERIVELAIDDEDYGVIAVPVPRTPEAWREQDDLLAKVIWRAWLRQTREVPAPLDVPSSDGGTSVEVSIPMEDPSPNPAS